MSSRNIRRMVAEKERREKEQREKDKQNEELGRESEEEYSPHFVQINPAFQGLEVSSDSESELTALSDPPDQLDQYQNEAAAVGLEENKNGAEKKIDTEHDVDNKNNKRKKKKKKKKCNKKPEEMDEVARSLAEVNKILGSPPRREEVAIVDERSTREKRLFSIHPNNINVNYELSKVFGDEDRLKKTRTGTRRMRHEIGLSPDVHQLRVKGLSMTRYKTEGYIKFFKFEHTQDYKARCMKLIQQLRLMLYEQMRHENNLHSEDCVEALLENFDYLYYVEEHTGANQTLEQSIFYMQIIGEQSFNFVDGKTRLLYNFVENRPFHIAILKYMHVLTNIACHRTALELAKVLLNLDPSDPLAVIFIIDTLAIRAREFQWLLDLIDHWRESRQAHRLFHMRYSRALAMFHIACKKKDYDGIDAASKALLKAIKYYPPVALKIIDFSKISVSKDISHHAIFSPPANVPVSRDLDDLMDLYSWLIAPRFREPQVWKWFMDAVTDITDQHDRSAELRDEVIQSARLRAQLYRRLPVEMKRHLYAIRPMAKYISDGRMPHVNPTVSFNPYPCEGTSTDTYNYFTDWAQEHVPPNNALMAFIQGLYPDIHQIGMVSKRALLRGLNRMEVTAGDGSYLIRGPQLATSEMDIELCTFRELFVPRRSYSPSARDADDYDADPMDLVDFQNAVRDYSGAGAILNLLSFNWRQEPAPVPQNNAIAHEAAHANGNFNANTGPGHGSQEEPNPPPPYQLVANDDSLGTTDEEDEDDNNEGEQEALSHDQANEGDEQLLAGEDSRGNQEVPDYTNCSQNERDEKQENPLAEHGRDQNDDLLAGVGEGLQNPPQPGLFVHLPASGEQEGPHQHDNLNLLAAAAENPYEVREQPNPPQPEVNENAGPRWYYSNIRLEETAYPRLQYQNRENNHQSYHHQFPRYRHQLPPRAVLNNLVVVVNNQLPPRAAPNILVVVVNTYGELSQRQVFDVPDNQEELNFRSNEDDLFGPDGPNTPTRPYLPRLNQRNQF